MAVHEEEKMMIQDDMLAPVSQTKLTTWVNEPSVTKLKEDVDGSKEAHDTFVAKVKKWQELHNVTGSQKPVKIKGRSQVQPKLIRRQAEWRYSALTEPFLSSDKLYNVKPTTFEDGEGAEQNDMVLNWQFRTKINRVRFIDSYVRAAVDEGSVIVRLGWNRITTQVEEQVPQYTYYAAADKAYVDSLDQARMLKMSDPRTYNEQTSPEMKAAVDHLEETNEVTQVIQTGIVPIMKENVIDNRPTVETINPENFYFDPSCGDDFDKANFACVSFETSKADLKKQPNRYKNLEAVNWESNTIIVATDHATQTPDNFNFKDKLRKRVVAYEYWGLYDVNNDGTLVPIVATWIGDVMVRMEENPFPDLKPPFIIANYMPIKRELMGEPDAELLEDNQKVLGAVTRGMIDLLARSANSQQGFAKGMLDTINRRRYENGQDYEFNPNMPPQNGIVEHKYPEIPQSVMLMLQLQNQEAEALTGVKAFSGGVSGEAYGDVAAGIRGALDAASKREMSILRRLAQGICDIGKKIVSMNQVFLSQEEVIRVTNEEFVTVNRDDIQGYFDLEVDISTAEIDNAKAQDLGFMLQTLGPNMDFGVTKIILVEIAKLKRMPVLAKTIENFEPQPDPIQVEIAKLQVEKLKMEIAKLQSEVSLNEVKAQKTDAEADAIDLDKTEKETGTTHERELEKMREQSKGNQSLEVTKALIAPKKEGETKPDIDAAIGFNAISSDLNKTARPAPQPVIQQF